MKRVFFYILLVIMIFIKEISNVKVCAINRVNTVGHYEDSILKDFLNENLLENSVLLESKGEFIFTQIDDRQVIDNFNDKISGNVYTFLCENEENPVYQIVFDLYCIQEISVTDSDILTVEIDEALWYYWPVKGELWTKDKENSSWKYQGDIIMSAGKAQQIFTYGSELKSKEKYFRILIYLSSNINPQNSKDEFYYIIQYTNFKYSLMNKIITLLILLIAILTCIKVMLKRKRIKGN